MHLLTPTFSSISWRRGSTRVGPFASEKDALLAYRGGGAPPPYPQTGAVPQGVHGVAGARMERMHLLTPTFSSISWRRGSTRVAPFASETDAFLANRGGGAPPPYRQTRAVPQGAPGAAGARMERMRLLTPALACILWRRGSPKVAPFASEKDAASPDRGGGAPPPYPQTCGRAESSELGGFTV
jgi:hypothetical protein